MKHTEFEEIFSVLEIERSREMKNPSEFIKSFLAAFTDPTKNFLLFFFCGLILLPIITNGISELFWSSLVDLMESQFGVNKYIVRMGTIGLIVALIFLLIYGTNFAYWLGNRVDNFFHPIREVEPNVSKLQETLRGLIVFGSNRESNTPAERAINYHWQNGSGKLQHCWVICTEASLPFVEAMVHRLENNGRVQFHYGHYSELKDDSGNSLSLMVPEDRLDDPNYIQDLVNAIYRDAGVKGLQESEVIADYTGGTKSMTAGMVLACVDPSRQLQYYSQQGLPTDKDPPMKVSISYAIAPKKKK
jgi:CRISPR-associated protein (Cas_Cas02710)